MASIWSCLSGTPLLGLSAIVTAGIVKDILQHLQVSRDDVQIQSIPPDQQNIYTKVISSAASVEIDLAWLINDIAANQTECPKTLVFAKSINCISDIYTSIMYSLGQKAYSNSIQDNKHSIIGMYHAHISELLQHFTLTEFAKANSVIRVLVCTIAFGMGIEIPDIRRVVHWGPTSSLLCFWQEFGRAGCDGKPASATWYARGKADADKEVFQKIKSDNSCVRQAILQEFTLPENDTSSLECMVRRQPCSAACSTCCCDLCKCCSFCCRCCPCAAK